MQFSFLRREQPWRGLACRNDVDRHILFLVIELQFESLTQQYPYHELQLSVAGVARGLRDDVVTVAVHPRWPVRMLRRLEIVRPFDQEFQRSRARVESPTR